MPGTRSCPSIANLEELVRGGLANDVVGDLHEHIDGCPSCQQRLKVLSAQEKPADTQELTADPARREREDTVDSGVEPKPAPHAAGADETPETGAALSFLSPPQNDDEIGRLGPYRAISVLGRGGMGVVLEAEDTRLRRRVALKVMSPELARKRTAKERFLREARAAAAIEHDHIISIFQVDEEGGIPFIAMPLLKGMTLERWLRTLPAGPSLRHILRIGKEIAEGLSAAHRQGLIHRDIKPSNIWLETRERVKDRPPAEAEGDGASFRVKILDFGLARLTQGEGEQNLTQEGAVLGTPSYMSPEQARAEAVDARADLFSLGIVLYRLCTGRLPFRGTDTMSTLMSLATDTPPAPHTLNAGIPLPLSQLVLQLLEKDKERRLASADAALDAFTDLERDLTMPSASLTPFPSPSVSGPHPSARPAPGKRRRLVMVAAMTLALVVVGYFVLAHFLGTPEGERPPDPKRARGIGVPAEITLDPEFGVLKGHTGAIKGLRFLPDGKHALSVAWDGTARLWDLTSGKEERVFPGGDKVLECLAVDAPIKLVATGGSAGKIYVSLFETGGPYRVLLKAPSPFSTSALAFLDDGKRLLAGKADGEIHLFHVLKSELEERIVLKKKAFVHSLCVLPGDKQFLYGLNNEPEFALWDIEQKMEVARFAGSGQATHGLALFEDGERVASVHSDGNLCIWSLATRKELARVAAHPDAHGVTVHVLHGDRWILTTGDDKAIRIWDTETLKLLHEKKTETWVTTRAAVSPDGQLLLTGGGWRSAPKRQHDNDHALRLWRLPLP